MASTILDYDYQHPLMAEPLGRTEAIWLHNYCDKQGIEHESGFMAFLKLTPQAIYEKYGIDIETILSVVRRK